VLLQADLKRQKEVLNERCTWEKKKRGIGTEDDHGQVNFKVKKSEGIRVIRRQFSMTGRGLLLSKKK